MTHLESEEIERIARLGYDWGKLKNKTVLLSGASGFLGQFFIEVINIRNAEFGDGIKVIGLSRRAMQDRDNVKYISCDITNPLTLNEHADFILHLASNTHPAQYASDPVGTIMTNVGGCYNLLKYATSTGAERFLLASSVEVYGESGLPIEEGFCGDLNFNYVRSGYNQSKRTAEVLCRSFKEQFGIDFVVARLSRCFGADTKQDSKVMAQFIDRALRNEDIVLISEGKQRYSYCYRPDAVSALFKILLNGESGECYNVAADDEGKTLADYAFYIAKLCNRKAVYKINPEGIKGASVACNAILNCDKLKALNWSPCYTVSDGIARTIKIKQGE